MTSTTTVFKFRISNTNEITEYECSIDEIIETIKSYVDKFFLVGVNYPEAIRYLLNYDLFLKLVRLFPCCKVEFSPCPTKGFEELCYIQNDKNF